jgi:hypothetical protein
VASPENNWGRRKGMIAVITEGNGMVDVHSAGCSALKEYCRGEVYTFDSIQDAEEEYVDTGDKDNPGYTLDEFIFYPCVFAQAGEPSPYRGTGVCLSPTSREAYRRGTADAPSAIDSNNTA